MLRSLKVFGALVPVLCAATVAQAQKPVLLRYKMTTNDALIYKITSAMKETSTFNVNNTKRKIETEFNSTEITVRKLERIDKKTNNLHLQTENKLLQVKIKNSEIGEYKYDSKSDENEKGSKLGGALTPVYDSLKGAFLKTTISSRGEVVEVKGFEELLAAALKDNPLGRQFAGGGTNKAQRFELAEFYPILSKKPVKPGDSWDEPFEMPLPKLGTAKGTRHYKFEGYDTVGKRKTARISYTMDLTFKLDIDMGGMKITGELSIEKSSGTVHFDPVKGHVVSVKSQYTLGGDLTASANGMDIAISTKQTQTITLNLLDKNPE